MTEVLTIEGGQKDALLRRANVFMVRFQQTPLPALLTGGLRGKDS